MGGSKQFQRTISNCATLLYYPFVVFVVVVVVAVAAVVIVADAVKR